MFLNSLEGQGTIDDRIDAFFRCVATLDLPNFSTGEAVCNSTYGTSALYAASCGELTSFADYFELNGVARNHISPDMTIPRNDSEPISLLAASLCCIEAISPQFTYYGYDFHDQCFGHLEDYEEYVYDYDIYYYGDKIHEAKACHMSSFKTNSHTSNGTLNFVLYTFLTIGELYFTGYPEDFTKSPITGGFLNTCKSLMFEGDTEKCIQYLFESCFEFDLYDPYFCFESILIELCSEFGGDERFKCEVILQERSISALEDTCSYGDNDAKCVSKQKWIH